MLFSRSKEREKSATPAFEANNSAEPHTIEEETIRRWRDMVQNRNQRSMFEEQEDELNFTPPNASAPQWPSSSSLQPPSNGLPFGSQFGSSSADEETAHDLHANWELETRYSPTVETPVTAEIELEPFAQHDIHESHFQLDPRANEATIIAPAQSANLQSSSLLRQTMPAQQTAPEIIETPPQPTMTPASRLVADLSLPIEQDLKRRFGTNIRSALGPGTVIEGTFKFDSPVCVDGTLTGEITSTSALIVGQEAVISGKITVGSLIVLGTVEGKVDATDLVEIRRGGMLEGDVITDRFVVEDGGWYNGKVKMLK